MVQGEAALGDDLFEGNALATRAEVFAGGSHCTAVVLSQRFVIVLDQGFQQMNDAGKLPWIEAVDQFVSVLFVSCHRHFDFPTSQDIREAALQVAKK